MTATLSLPRLLVNPDRTVLVWLHADGTYALATREDPDAIWGPPIELVDDGDARARRTA